MTGSTRERMVTATVRLLAQRGPAGTSLSDVLEAADAPRGSIYHHFPGGRSQLYTTALDAVTQRTLDDLEAVRGEPAEVVLDHFFSRWRHLVTATDFAAGCAVLSVAVGEPDPLLVSHAGELFARWQEVLASLLADSGLAAPEAESLASLALAAAEGAVAISRARRDIAVFDAVVRSVTSTVAPT